MGAQGIKGSERSPQADLGLEQSGVRRSGSMQLLPVRDGQASLDTGGAA
jgi:hypothetical protein